MGGRKTVKYQSEILQALNLVNQNSREIHGHEIVEVVCSTCREIHGLRPFYTIIKRFKEKWYGWECQPCSNKRRKRSAVNFWKEKKST